MTKTSPATRSARPYLAAGIAALGASAIALAPVQPIPNHVSLDTAPAIKTVAVDLAAAVNPIAAWVDTIQSTAANITTLGSFALEQPFPIATTLLHNWGVYAQEILSGNIQTVFGQIENNFRTLFAAPFDTGVTVTLTNATVTPNQSVTIPAAGVPGFEPYFISDACSGAGNCGSPANLNLLAVQITAGGSLEPPSDPINLWSTIVKFAPVWRFLATPASGALLGLLGPVLSPIASVLNTFSALGRDLKAGNLLDAVYEIVNVPANLTNAVFNGARLDLTPVLEAFGVNLHNPDSSIQIGNFGLKLGGLLNVTPIDTPATAYNMGTGFNALSGDPNDPGTFLADNALGVPTGLGGSFVGMGQYLAGALRVSPVVKAKAKAASVEAAPVVVDTPAVDAAPAVADAAAEAKAPSAAAPAHRGAARTAAATSGDNERPSGHSRSARGSRGSQ